MFSFSAPPRLFMSLLFFLHLSTVLTCDNTMQHDCECAPFVPGHNLVGEGFNLVTLQRTGAFLIDVYSFLSPNGTCILRRNPLQGNMLQKLPLSVVDWRAFRRCKVGISSSMHTSLGLDFLKFVGVEVGGSHSVASGFASAKTKVDRYTFSRHSATCKHYSYRVSEKPPLSYEFSQVLKNLPSSYNISTRAQYRRIIETYGTHYIRQVYLGGRIRRVTATRTCLASLSGFSASAVYKVQNCLSTGFSVGLGKFSVSPKIGICNKVYNNEVSSSLYSSSLHQHYTEVVGGKDWTGEFALNGTKSDQGYRKWLTTLKDHPDVVQYSLRPMYELATSQTKRQGMKAAIEKYLKDNAIKNSSKQPSCGGSDQDLDSSCCPKKARRGTLEVTVIRGWNLKGDYWHQTDGFVKLRHGSNRYTTRIIHLNNPVWNESHNFSMVDTLQSLHVELWDEDTWQNDLLFSRFVPLKQGTHHHTLTSPKGNVEIIIILTCDHKLAGDSCERYKPSPN
uniref:MACPF domain-containing protein n=1 Tax=Echeneis naucrates TaxID=173247 RepID=A0A665TXJ0_ECHNA